MKKSITVGLFLVTGICAQAYSAEYQTVFKCFNQVQVADGPIVSILTDPATHQLAVETQGRGSQHIIPLIASRAMILDGGLFEGQGVSVAIHNGVETPPFGGSASVTLKDLDLTYKCERVRSN